MKAKTYIIAEVGVNHNGNVQIAVDAIKAAKQAGADCVKFQTFKAEQIVTESSPKATYQLKVTNPEESQFQMLKKLELSLADYKVLMQICAVEEIDFLSTPYNKEDVDFLESLGVSMYKIASGQLTETPFLEYVAQTKKKIFLSTGMGTLADVFDAVEVIRSTGNHNLCVLQCTTNYPSVIEDTNLKAMLAIKKSLEVEIGYSDHVPENYACLAAVALGAKVIEKHFTLDKTLAGPDHSCSLEPEGFASLVYGIRQTELALGSAVKRPTDAEKRNSYGMKRSMVASVDLEAGKVIKEEDIAYKRPANGLAPHELSLVIGKKMSRSLKKDEPFQYDAIDWK